MLRGSTNKGNLEEFGLSFKPATIKQSPKSSSSSVNITAQKTSTSISNMAHNNDDPVPGTSGASNNRTNVSSEGVIKNFKGIDDFKNLKIKRTRELFLTFLASNHTVSLLIRNFLKKIQAANYLVASESTQDPKYVFAYIVLNKLVNPEQFRKLLEQNTGLKCIDLKKVSNKRTFIRSVVASGCQIWHKYSMNNLLPKAPENATATKKKDSAKRRKVPLTVTNLNFLKGVVSDSVIDQLVTPNTNLPNANEENINGLASTEKELEAISIECGHLQSFQTKLEQEVNNLEEQLRKKKDELKRTTTAFENLKADGLALCRELKSTLKKDINASQQHIIKKEKQLQNIRSIYPDEDSQLNEEDHY